MITLGILISAAIFPLGSLFQVLRWPYLPFLVMGMSANAEVVARSNTVIFATDCQFLASSTTGHDYEIRFPADAIVDCGITDPDTLTFKGIGCDLLAVSSADEIIPASGVECYKMLRTYRVINWCEYDGEAPPVVVGRDEDCDGKPGDEAVWVLCRNNGSVFFDRDNDETNNSPLAGVKGRTCDGLTNPVGYWMKNYIDGDAILDPFTGQEDNDTIRHIDSRGYWQYTQVIKVFDRVDPVITVAAYDVFPALENENCDGLVSILFSITDECSQIEGIKKVWLDTFIVDADGDGNFAQWEFGNDVDVTNDISREASGFVYRAFLPVGIHALSLKVSDDCGNEGLRVITFEVVDTKAPVPNCIPGLTVGLLPTEGDADVDGDGDVDAAAMAIWANDLIASPTYDCHGQGPTQNLDGKLLVTDYSINLVGKAIDRAATSLLLTCGSDETTLVEIHAWDEAGNHSSCEIHILVQDIMDGCELEWSEGAIVGQISTAKDEAVANAEVILSGFIEEKIITDNSGYFKFQNLPLNAYSITPSLDESYQNGVTTYDLILIGKHILSIERLDSPYKMIAADVNNSKEITAMDMVIARQNILGITNGFTNNTSWRFVDADYVFPSPHNPWVEAFPETKSFNNLRGEQIANFVAIKIGDINTTAIPNNLIRIDERTSGTFTFNVEDIKMKAGNTYAIEFLAKDIEAIEGYQGTFTFGKAIDVQNILYGASKEGNFGTNFLENGLLTTSWNGEARPSDVLFTLILTAKEDAQLSEQLSLSSIITPAEAYHKQGGKLNLAIQFNTGKMTEVGFELYQNQPNPFLVQTVIGFHLPLATEATFKVHDISGKVIKLIRGNFAKGYNQIVLQGDDLASDGNLFYTITADKFTATKKMIRLK